ncbi:MAG: hypothetical protein CMO55_14450 [Verrucomicrobiales bacterium]|nr:hypothetical protein [Verrucomicrobiales bacterium]
MTDAELVKAFFRQDAAYTFMSFKDQARLFAEWRESIGEPAEMRMCWFPWIPFLVFMVLHASLLYWVREVADFSIWTELIIQSISLLTGIFVLIRFFPRGRIVRKEKEAS